MDHNLTCTRVQDPNRVGRMSKGTNTACLMASLALLSQNTMAELIFAQLYNGSIQAGSMSAGALDGSSLCNRHITSGKVRLCASSSPVAAAMHPKDAEIVLLTMKSPVHPPMQLSVMAAAIQCSRRAVSVGLDAWPSASGARIMTCKQCTNRSIHQQVS